MHTSRRRGRTRVGGPRGRPGVTRIRALDAGLRRDLGGEIRRLLFDALAERVAHERRHRDGCANLALGLLQRLRDGLRGVDHEGLVQEADLLEVGLQAGFHDLLDDVRRLARVLIGEHGLLARDRLGGNAGRIDRDRVRGRDVHRDLLAEKHERVGGSGRLQADQHADLAKAV
jgi:hypothetical protein